MTQQIAGRGEGGSVQTFPVPLDTGVREQDERVAGTSLLTHADWLPAEPVDMFAIQLDWMDEPGQPVVNGTEPQTSHVRPRPPTRGRPPAAARRLLGDPFDLTRRSLLPSIDTLTIRRSRDGARFVLHQRDADFSLWHNMPREYGEEFLGNFEHETSVSEPTGYEGAEHEGAGPFRSLNQARREGKLRAWCFGTGLDPLTLWGEILTAVVIDDDVFEQVFGRMVAANDEGTAVLTTPGGKPRRGVPFVEDVVERLLTYEPAAPAAAGCIALAWRHRDQLLAG